MNGGAMKNIKIFGTIIGLLILASGYLMADIFPSSTVKPPRFKKSAKPEYPIDAKKAGKEGKVVLQATIDVNGIPLNIVALTKLGFGFEEAAIEALKKSSFYPATEKGKPISVAVRIPYEFKLESAVGKMVLIPAGEFQMGSSTWNTDEKPEHTVYVNAFYIDKRN